MAGIGFVLRKLVRKDNLFGMVHAYFHGVLASSGPWVITVLALGCLYYLTRNLSLFGELEVFRAIILYNFCFSLVFSSPSTVIVTRYLADHIYERDLDTAPAMLSGAIGLNALIVLPIAIAFYGFYFEMGVYLKLLAIINFMLIFCIWILSVFISAIKTYRGVTFSFIAGILVTLYLSTDLARGYSREGMLFGFNIGLMIIIASLVALVYTEYPKRFKRPFAFLSYYKRHLPLALGSLFYTLGIWVHIWVMWFSPQAIKLPSGFLVYPIYDSSMFMAYLTVIPGMAMFLISLETAFFEKYVKFYADIMEHANFKKIQTNQHSLMECIAYHGRNLLIMQFALAAFVILAAPKIFEFAGVSLVQIGVFRFGVLGAAFHLLSLCLLIINSYFENRKAVFWIQLYFFVSNTVFTIITLKLGFPYYGMGYALSSITTFCLSAYALENFVRKLPYHTFITTNEALRYAKSID